MPRFNSNQILEKAINYGDRLVGHSARKYENAANVMRDAKGMGIKGVSSEAITGSRSLSEKAKGESFRTRLKTGLTAVTGISGGFLGLHKYQQHKDNKILERIDRDFKVR